MRDINDNGPIFCHVISRKIVGHCMVIVVCGNQKWNGAIPILRRSLARISVGGIILK
jgi:hypothetical protein